MKKLPLILILFAAVITLLSFVSATSWNTYTFSTSNLSVVANANAVDAIYSGVQFKPFRNIILTNVTTYTQDSSTTCYLQNSTFVTLASASVTNHNATFNYFLQEGVTYNVVCTGGNMGYSLTGFTPQYTVDINFTNQVYNNAVNNGGYRRVWALGYNIVSSTIVLNSPPANYSTVASIQTYNATVYIIGAGNIVNISLFDNSTGVWKRNQTQLMTGTKNTTTFLNSLILIGKVNWGIEACDSDGTCGVSDNRTVTVNSISSKITKIFPTGIISYGYVGQNLSVNYTINTTGIDKCWLNYNNVNVTVSCTKNASIILTSQKTATLYINDTANVVGSASFGWDYTIFQNGTGSVYDATVSETDYIPISVNATGMTSANVFYDGVSHPAAISGTIATVYIHVPLASTSTSHSFIWKFNGDSITAPFNYTQTSTPIYFIPCNGTIDIPYANVTFYDETTLLPVNGYIPNMNILYSIGGSIYKSEPFFSGIETQNYLFCFTPNKSLDTAMTIEYTSTGYGARNIVRMNTLDNNSITNIALPLLATASGQSTKLQISDAYSNYPIGGAKVDIYRSINNSYNLLTTDYTGVDGAVIVLLDPTLKHRAVITYVGYSTATVDFTPSADTYPVHLIPLTSPATSINISNMTYVYAPKSGTLLNNTMYNLTLNTTTSGISNLQAIRIILSNTTSVISYSQINVTGDFTSLGLVMNTTNNKKLIAKFYGSTNVSGGGWVLLTTGTYVIYNTYEGENSLLHAIKSLTNLNEDNEDKFPKIFIVLLLIIIGYASFTRYTGMELQSPGLSMLLFTIVIIALCAGNFLTLNITSNDFINQYGFAVIAAFVSMGFTLGRWRDS